MNIRTVTHENLKFVDVHDPQELELKELKNTYGFRDIHIEDYLEKKQFPEIEVAEKYVLIALDFPYFDDSNPDKKAEDNKNSKENNEESTKPEIITSAIKEVIVAPVSIPSKLLFSESHKKRISTGHINFYIGDDYVVVLHDEKTPQIDEILESCQGSLHKREEIMTHGPYHLFYRLVNSLVHSSYIVMSQITGMIDEIDIYLLKNNPPIKVVEDISVTRRNIVFFKSMIEPTLQIFTDLANGKYENVGKENKIYWKSIQNHLQKIKYRLHGSHELIEGIARSHESLLTVKTNEIVKVLTMFTAILLPLTFIASIYGMNIVGLPLAENTQILKTLSLLMIVLSLIMILGFKVKKWF